MTLHSLSTCWIPRACHSLTACHSLSTCWIHFASIRAKFPIQSGFILPPFGLHPNLSKWACRSLITCRPSIKYHPLITGRPVIACQPLITWHPLVTCHSLITSRGVILKHPGGYPVKRTNTV